MNAKDAAERIRPTFALKTSLDAMSVEDRHRIKFLTDVAAALGVDPSPFNLLQVEEALTDADIKRDENEYPKMLFSRHPAPNGMLATYDRRHDHFYAHVENADQEQALGTFIADIAKLPPREVA